MDMCPAAEIMLRENKRLLHILETLPRASNSEKPVADRKKVVKCYSRSAAGKAMENPKYLRPTNVLLRTINYLLQDVLTNTRVPWNVTYDFITDRLRSVRQDMIIQNLPVIDSIKILQPIVNFHAYASYRLCEESLNHFDPVLNKTHLQECIKRLLCLYDEYERIIEKITNDDKMVQENRPRFEALYVILNLSNPESVIRALRLPETYKNKDLKLAIDVSLNYIRGNFVRVCKHLRDLQYLLLALSSLHLPEIRKKVLQTMSVAYNSKNLTFPLEILKNLFLYNTVDDVISECKHYGLHCDQDNVHFLKDNFNRNQTLARPTRLNFLDKQVEDRDIVHLILNI